MTTTESIAPSLTVTPPHSQEAEEAVIGSVLIDPLCLFELSFLSPGSFFIKRHAWIWSAFVKLSERNVPIDTLHVEDELERMGVLAEAGGPAYLTKLIGRVPTSSNAQSYGRMVQESASKRQMLEVASGMAKLAFSGKNTQESLAEARAQLDGIQDLSGHSLTPFGDLLKDTYEEIQVRAKSPKDVWGLATGLPKFDHETGGLHEAELLYLVGAPGAGKTWLMLGWTVELGRQAPGAIFSLEMKKLAIGRRILSGISGVSTRAMKSGYMKEEDWPRLTSALEQHAALPVLVGDSAYDTHTLRAALVWAKREYGIRWFMVDYAMLLTDRGKDETEQTKIISANMKRIVNDLNLAGVVIQSVVKLGMNEHSEPDMSDQRGSGQAVHDADLQVFLTQCRRDEYTPDQRKNMVTLWVSKGRELERSRFSLTLVRRGNTPFWAELEEGRREEKYKGRKDLE